MFTSSWLPLPALLSLPSTHVYCHYNTADEAFTRRANNVEQLPIGEIAGKKASPKLAVFHLCEKQDHILTSNTDSGPRLLSVNPALPISSCVSSDYLRNLSVHRFPHLEDEVKLTTTPLCARCVDVYNTSGSYHVLLHGRSRAELSNSSL